MKTYTADNSGMFTEAIGSVLDMEKKFGRKYKNLWGLEICLGQDSIKIP